MQVAIQVKSIHSDKYAVPKIDPFSDHLVLATFYYCVEVNAGLLAQWHGDIVHGKFLKVPFREKSGVFLTGCICTIFCLHANCTLYHHGYILPTPVVQGNLFVKGKSFTYKPFESNYWSSKGRRGICLATSKETTGSTVECFNPSYKSYIPPSVWDVHSKGKS